VCTPASPPLHIPFQKPKLDKDFELMKDGMKEMVTKGLEKPVTFSFEKADSDSFIKPSEIGEAVLDALVTKVNVTKRELASFKKDILDKPIVVNVTELPKVRERERKSGREREKYGVDGGPRARARRPPLSLSRALTSPPHTLFLFAHQLGNVKAEIVELIKEGTAKPGKNLVDGLSAAVAEAKAQKAAGKEGTKAAEASLESAKAALKNRLNQVVADKTMH
jgi:hypothetical protein